MALGTKLTQSGLCAHSVCFWQVGFFKRNLKEKMEADGAIPSGSPGEGADPLAVSGEETNDQGCLEPLHVSDKD